VELKDGWEESEPLSGEIKDGKMYGRGSADTKSNAAAAMVAVKNAYEEFEDPNVLLVLESDEEVGFEGANRFLSKYDAEDLNTEFTVMCEPKDQNIVTKHKGVLPQ
jgi:acetylornithine deacetylase/succinyl-diaminopimelate desuccinylase-like protein